MSTPGNFRSEFTPAERGALIVAMIRLRDAQAAMARHVNAMVVERIEGMLVYRDFQAAYEAHCDLVVAFRAWYDMIHERQ